MPVGLLLLKIPLQEALPWELQTDQALVTTSRAVLFFTGHKWENNILIEKINGRLQAWGAQFSSFFKHSLGIKNGSTQTEGKLHKRFEEILN